MQELATKDITSSSSSSSTSSNSTGSSSASSSSSGKGGSGKEEASLSRDLLQLIQRAKHGDPTLATCDSAEVLRLVPLFKDELTLDNASRPQLVSMCRFMNLTPFGADSFLRYQLRSTIRQLKSDDQRILWEGLASLNNEELAQACEVGNTVS